MICKEKKEAREKGLKFYYTGKSCKRGHICNRHTKNSMCVECIPIDARKNRDKYPEKQKAKSKKYRSENKEKQDLAVRDWYKKNPEKRKIYNDKSNLNHPLRNKKTSWVRNGIPDPTRPYPKDSLCECCKKPEDSYSKKTLRQLCNDHDHVTNKFRGWLCNSCNRGMGMLGDNIAGLEMALNYLKVNNANETI